MTIFLEDDGGHPEILLRMVKNNVAVMAASDPNFRYGPETWENFAGAIHGLVCSTRALGPKTAADQTRRLRETLAGMGIAAPAEGDFIYYGGRCFPVPDLFKPDEVRAEIAKALARDIVDAIGTTDGCSDAEVTEILAASAALDEEMLFMRTKRLAMLLKERRPDLAVDEYLGRFTVLPDGTMLSLHYLYAG